MVFDTEKLAFLRLFLHPLLHCPEGVGQPMPGAPGPVMRVRHLSRRFRVAIFSDRILKIAQFIRDIEPTIA